MELAVGAEPGARHEPTDAHLRETLAAGISLLGVADGFGAPGRDSANAALALASVRDYLRRRQRLGMLVGKANSPSAVRTFLLHALEQANERLFSASGSTDDFVAGGVSLTAALVAGHHVFIGHVGDSRAYVLRLGRLEALTADDAIFTNAVASSKSSLPAKPALRGLLWRSLGTQSRLEASIAHVELLPGDQLLLCTDGVHRAVFVDEIESALTESDSAAEVASRLLLMTKVRGIADSATVLVGRDLLTPEMPTADPHGGAALMARVWLIAALLSSIAAASWFALHHL